MDTCEIKELKRVIFIFSRSAFRSDRNYQAARMALSLALDSHLALILMADALVLAFRTTPITKELYDYWDQERFLLEMEVPVYVLQEDLLGIGRSRLDLREHVQIISADGLDTLLHRAHVVLTV